jgi:alkanesulfonate monooxygenase SsuD/methylene tetrahydromethanopterin reductase-like flavin-dependent oxidoreductase (luciferase family)
VAPLSADQWDGADAAHVAELARAVEQAGLDSLWANDSLTRPRIDALTFLTIAAAATDRVQLGTAALLPALRRPVHTGHVLATLDRLSAGRLTVAVGAGFPGVSEPEYAASLVPWQRRARRLDETVALWRRMWSTTERAIEFRGEVLTLDAAPAGISPSRPDGPPLWLAADTDRARRRAGLSYDGWLPYPTTADRFAAGLADVHAAAQQGGRSPDQITAALFVTILVTDGDDARDALDAFTIDTYGLPLAAVERIQAFAAGPADVVTDKLQSYVNGGARHLVCRVGVTTREQFVEQVQQLASVRERFI